MGTSLDSLCWLVRTKAKQAQGSLSTNTHTTDWHWLYNIPHSLVNCDYSCLRGCMTMESTKSSFTFTVFLQSSVQTCRDFRKPHLEVESLSKVIPLMLPPLSTPCRSCHPKSTCISIQIFPPFLPPPHYWVKYSPVYITMSTALTLFLRGSIGFVPPMSPCRCLFEISALLFHFAISCFL